MRVHVSVRGFVLVLVVACAVSCSGKGKSQVYERFDVVFDGRPWVTVYQDEGEKDSIVQYVPEGSTILDWTEMVTQRSFRGLQKTGTAESEMNAARKLAEERCARVDWNVVGQEPGSIRYVAAFADCKEERPAHEVGRFVMSSRAIYLVQYQTKKTHFAEDQQKAWSDLLGRAHYEDLF